MFIFTWEDPLMERTHASSQQHGIFNKLQGILQALGVVFGDIGTSPIYTLPAIFLLITPTQENIIGAVSLIITTLTVIVCIEYAWLAMNLSRKGEGGTIVLKEILKSLLHSQAAIMLITILSCIGIALFIGDGVITPAISILSAIEGLRYIPGLELLQTTTIVALACIITIILFLFQRRGVENVSKAFGPIMVIWFATLFVSGLFSIAQFPGIIVALNPYYGIKLLVNHGTLTFLILASVLLCATGAEALYADMGHLGRTPIRQAWVLVFVALIINYMGQGAFLIYNPHAELILYKMILYQAGSLYIPFLILSLIATVIASQAMISGIFAVVYQGITTRVMPMFKVEYTSTRLHSQVYISGVNWMLLAASLFMILKFQESLNLAAAYGLAVSATMVITGTMMTSIFTLRKNRFKQILVGMLAFINIIFFISTLFKIPQGGYWSLIIASIPLTAILIYVSGQKRIRRAIKPALLTNFAETFAEHYPESDKISGTALFFVRNVHAIYPWVNKTMFDNDILYENNILISVIKKETPHGIDVKYDKDFREGLQIFEIHAGYMELINVEKILKHANIEAKAIFYGIEEIVTKNLVWRIFATIKRISPTFVQFYKVPSSKLHGVVTVVHI